MVDKELTGEVIKVYYKVYNSLGYGFLESVYKNAMMIELAAAGLAAEAEKPIAVKYAGRTVGNYAADIVVNDRLIVELKAREALSEAHEAQLVNYLRATHIEIGLLFNFGKVPEFKRKYFSNQNKLRNSNSSENGLLAAIFQEDPFRSA
ncbi:MAG TPA: GxxExxY protein [Blastocatellia bacterium]|nr:GxxExxY protein [Blastocatellia bacterium]